MFVSFVNGLTTSQGLLKIRPPIWVNWAKFQLQVVSHLAYMIQIDPKYRLIFHYFIIIRSSRYIALICQTIQFNKILGFKWFGHGNMPFELLMSSDYVANNRHLILYTQTLHTFQGMSRRSNFEKCVNAWAPLNLLGVSLRSANLKKTFLGP